MTLSKIALNPITLRITIKTISIMTFSPTVLDLSVILLNVLARKLHLPGRVFNSRIGCTNATQLGFSVSKRPSLKLKTRLKQLFGYLTLGIQILSLHPVSNNTKLFFPFSVMLCPNKLDRLSLPRFSRQI
jgi:hypothetical protein